jgi:hypothetical protein
VSGDLERGHPRDYDRLVAVLVVRRDFIMFRWEEGCMSAV